ncbi:hypothetical protein [Bradyrhizobium roseum]|uniref:hypothetical protein n=1 Tax=Bradyrhizobium roseum TaxID=3056648 RepID=UPI00263929B7|nr:hypothetical protein [Bradyrhizobium roseus]WKA31510.1 hypothetical protein QUH67_15715 [Bradyrhizobium roseus]
MIFISSSTRWFAWGMAKNPLSSEDDGRPYLFQGTTLERSKSRRADRRPYSLSAVRIKAVISTAIPTDVTAKNILGMRATILPDPCVTLTAFTGPERTPSRIGIRVAPLRPAEKLQRRGSIYTLGKRVVEFETRTHTNTGAQSSQSLTVTMIRAAIMESVTSAHVRCTTFFAEA